MRVLLLEWCGGVEAECVIRVDITESKQLYHSGITALADGLLE